MLVELAGSNIDRVLVNTRFYWHSLEGVRLAKRIGAPVIVLDHGSAHLTIGNGVLDWFVERYEHAITNRMKHLEPSFAGISRASAAWLTHFDIETVTVIPNAIDAKQFRGTASRRDFRTELDAVDKTLVAFVGRLEPEKGSLQFAQAASLLGGNYVLALAGEGSQRIQIEGLDADNVILLGQLDQPDLSAFLRDADVFCLPTRSEGFCISLLEAAVQGAIPVMPRVGITDEVMGWNPVRYGVLMRDRAPESVAEGIREASLSDDATARNLADCVKDCFSWSATVDALEHAFNSLS